MVSVTYLNLMVNHTRQRRVRFVTTHVQYGHRLTIVGLIRHGLALCAEYTHRYNKVHSCQHTMLHANIIFPNNNDIPTSYTRAMPERFKYDTSIDTFTAYKDYIRYKSWPKSNSVSYTHLRAHETG